MNWNQFKVVQMHMLQMAQKGYFVETKLTDEELNNTIYDLHQENKILQQKLMRRDYRVSNMG